MPKPIQKPTLLSVIVPCFNEADNIMPFHESFQQATSELRYAFEILFVDDGSSDATASIVEELAKKDPRIRLIKFVRNFGKEAAISAGLNQAKGEAALIIDADLQHPPDRIPEFIEAWSEGAEVVVGIRSTSKEHATRLKRLSSVWFYKLMRAISDTAVTEGSTDYRLVDRVVLDEFNRLTERNRLTRGLIDWLGFSRAYVYFKPAKRLNGEAVYSYTKLTQLAIHSIVSTSLFPLQLAGYLGAIIMFISLPLGVFIFIEKYLLSDPLGLYITGTAQLAVVLLFLVGIILICLGLIALYIATIHAEVLNRPLYIVRKSER